MNKVKICPEYCRYLGEDGCTISVGDYINKCPNDDPKLLKQIENLDDDWLGRGRATRKPPSHPPRPCRKIGCKNITTNRNGYCDMHQDVAAAKEEARKQRSDKGNDKRLPAAKRGYGAKWQKLRECKLRESPLCDVCGRAATVVHHRDHNQFNDAWDNLQCLCRSCHEELHGRKRKVG